MISPVISRTGPSRQRGALIFITPIVISAVLLMIALALDGARLYSLRSEMQSQVDAAATAAADAAQACGGDTITLATMSQRALAAAQAQGFSGDPQDLVVTPGLLEAGSGDEVAFHAVPDLAQSNATHVRYQRSEPISRLLPESVLGSVTLEASAAVRREVVATISAAGSTAGVDGGLLGALLGGVLGQPGYSLDATDLASIGNTLFSVGDLLADLGVDQLEDALPLGADELATAIRNVAGAATPAGDLAGRLLSANGIESVAVSDVISALADTRVPSDANVRAYDLLVSLALNVLQQQQLLSGNPLVLNNLAPLGLPLVSAIDDSSLEIRLYVNRPPTVAIGPARQNSNGDWLTTFRAPDLSLEVDVSAGLPTINLLGLAEFGIGSLQVPLSVDLGGGSGALVSARCARGGTNSVQFGMALERDALELGTGQVDTATGALVPDTLSVQVGHLKLLAGLLTLDPAVGADIVVDGSVGSASTVSQVTPAYPLYCGPSGCERMVYDASGGGLSSADFYAQVSDLQVLGASVDTSLINSLLAVVEGLVNDITTSVLNSIVNPLAEALGVGIGGMQVSIESATQQGSQLVEGVPILQN